MWIRKKDIDSLVALGVRDSKEFTSNSQKFQREQLFVEIKEISLGWKSEINSALVIDDVLKSKKTNLSLFEVEIMVNLVKSVSPAEAYIDAVGKAEWFRKMFTSKWRLQDKTAPNIISLQRMKSDFLMLNNVTIIARNKADVLYPIVSAASILAKVTRDRELRKIEEEYRLDVGTLGAGYPQESDKAVMSFLSQYKQQIRRREFPFIRYEWNWRPLQEIITKKPSKLRF